MLKVDNKELREFNIKKKTYSHVKKMIYNNMKKFYFKHTVFQKKCLKIKKKKDTRL